MTLFLTHRLAEPDDFDALIALQTRATLGLSSGHYDLDTMRIALKEVPILTRDLIEDGHYHVLAEPAGAILAGGGWSDRATGYSVAPTDTLPSGHALVRAVYVEPSVARRGLGSRIMEMIETDAIANGIRHLALTATLPGQLLYEYLGYRTLQPIERRLSNGYIVRLIAMEKALLHDPRTHTARSTHRPSSGQRQVFDGGQVSNTSKQTL